MKTLVRSAVPLASALALLFACPGALVAAQQPPANDLPKAGTAAPAMSATDLLMTMHQTNQKETLPGLQKHEKTAKSLEIPTVSE